MKIQTTHTICDRCTKEIQTTVFDFFGGSSRDASGNSVDITLDADLCANCINWLFRELLNSMPRYEAWEYLRSIKPLDPKYRETVFVKSDNAF
jgi:hypothetical protein